MDPQRARILRHMEVDTYFLRPTSAELAAGAAVRSAPEPAVEGVPAARTRSRPNVRPAEPAARRKPDVQQPPPSQIAVAPEPPAAAAEAAPEPVEPFTLHCVRAAEALLFCQSQQNPALRRLANDVAASVRVALDAPPAELKRLEFRYPHLAGASADWRPALRAFTAKQVDVARPRLVMVAADVAERFDWLQADAQALGDIARLLMIDELSALHADAERKRALWQQIRKHLA